MRQFQRSEVPKNNLANARDTLVSVPDPVLSSAAPAVPILVPPVPTPPIFPVAPGAIAPVFPVGGGGRARNADSGECDQDTECEDENPCTLNTCVNQVCINEFIPGCAHC